MSYVSIVDIVAVDAVAVVISMSTVDIVFAAVSSHELERGFDYGGFTFIC